jgi:hypothetical protein
MTTYALAAPSTQTFQTAASAVKTVKSPCDGQSSGFSMRPTFGQIWPRTVRQTS